MAFVKRENLLTPVVEKFLDEGATYSRLERKLLRNIKNGEPINIVDVIAADRHHSYDSRLGVKYTKQ
jgi:hypothetical protein